MPTLSRLSRASAVVCASLSAACGGRTAGGASEWELYWNLQSVGRVEICAPAGAPLELARVVAGYDHGDLFDVAALEQPSGSPSGRVWVGDVTTPGAERALEHLGIEPLEAAGFRFQGSDYGEEQDCLIATIEDPQRPGMPLTVLLGHTPEVAAHYLLDWRPSWRRFVRTYRGGHFQRESALTRRGELRPGALRHIGGLRKRMQVGAATTRGTGYQVRAMNGVDLAGHEEWLAALDGARESARALFGASAKGVSTPVRLWVYAHPEDKARMTRDWSLASVDPLGRNVSTVLAPGLPHDGGYGLALAVAWQLGGPPASEWLHEGFAAASVETWWGRPMPEWLAYLHFQQLTPTVVELLEGGVSAHVRVPMRGALVRYLRETSSAEAVLELWRGERELSATDPTLAGFYTWLDGQCDAALADDLQVERIERMRAIERRPFRQGVNLCEPPVQDDLLIDGFGTRGCTESVRAAAATGINALAIVTRAWIDPGLAEEPVGRLRSPARASASDLALAATIFEARTLELDVTLKPQLLVSPSSHWAGPGLFNSIDNQERFLRAYRSFVVHYGLLAELTGCEMLCIGSEMPEVSVSVGRRAREADMLDRFQDAFREVIAEARRAFGGALFYDARWQTESRGIQFWSDLDFVGQKLFGTVASAAEPDLRPDATVISRVLAFEMGRVADLAREWDKRGIVTEVGIPSTRDAWRDPARRLGPADFEMQQRFYEGLRLALDRASASRESARSSLAGVFVWNWWTDARAAGADRRYTPQNKPAEASLRRAFSR